MARDGGGERKREKKLKFEDAMLVALKTKEKATAKELRQKSHGNRTSRRNATLMTYLRL